MRGNFAVTGLPPAELLEHAAHDRLDGREHVLLLDEAHLQVELVELAGRTVGARVLVAEAGRDLEVAVEARDHDQLLELLRRLRQGVELARMHARGHQDSRARPRALEAVRIGVWNSKKPLSRMRRRIEPMISLRSMMLLVQRLAPQIEEAVLQPQVLRIVRLAEHRNRQLLGRRQHLDLAGEHLHLAGRQLRVDACPSGRSRTLPSTRITHSERTVSADLEGRAVGVGHHLRQAVVVAQVDEQQAAVVAHAMHPARQPHGTAPTSPLRSAPQVCER